MKNKNNWKQISAWLLVACIVGSVFFANRISEVRALKRETAGWIASASNAIVNDNKNSEEETLEPDTSEESTEESSTAESTTAEETKKTETSAAGIKKNETTAAAATKAQPETKEEPAASASNALKLPEDAVTITDADGNVAVTGDLPEDATVTAEKLSLEKIQELGLSNEEIVFAYDITIWVDGEEYQPEKPVVVKVLNAENSDREMVITHLETDDKGEVTSRKKVQSTVDEDGTVEFQANHFSYYVGMLENASRIADDVVQLDLAYGDITFSDETYTYSTSTQTGLSADYTEDKKYEIVQTNSGTPTAHTIKIGTSSTPVTGKYVIYLSGINIQVTSSTGIPIYVNAGDHAEVYLVLKNGTSNTVALNSTGSLSNVHAAVEKELNTGGLLCITCEEGYDKYTYDTHAGHSCAENSSCGKLRAYGNRAQNGYTNYAYYSGAGIGSRGKVNGGSVSDGEVTATAWLKNIVIAGGIIEASGAVGDSNYSGGGAGIGVGCSADPAGSNCTSAAMTDFSITGGYITAKGGDNSAACIGGGYRSNKVEIDIYGGTIDATSRVKENDNLRTAGIGAGGGGTQSGSPSVAVVNIYGGKIVASSKYGAGIGGSGGGTGTGGYEPNSQDAYVNIYGGDITATTTGVGAAIGSGGPLGTITAGSAGKAYVTISGGTIHANSASGADIGGGGVISSSAKSNGGAAEVEITGGEIYSTKGGIGGGKANAGLGGVAEVKISGGTVEATSIGGGDSATNNGGDATIYVSDQADVTLTGGIGGGNSTSDATTENGGNAEVHVTGGKLVVAGKIGGGESSGAGAGGDAAIIVEGGLLDCASVGGGDSNTGTPGAVVSSSGAGVIISGGTVRSGFIGGGKNKNNAIGFATANISGGNIQGQFILANTVDGKKCTFVMTDGTIDNENLGSSANTKYVKAQEDGGAVYLSDKNGEVSISGGTIKNSNANFGGAIYMSAGKFKLSGTGSIGNCTAKSGGAVYLAGGNIEISGGNIGTTDASNSAELGGGIYLGGNGTVEVTGGKLQNNTATQNGGAAYLAQGSMTISGGEISDNTATQNGGAAYLADGNIEISGGNIGTTGAPNKAELGGGIYLGGNGTIEVTGGKLQNNSASKDGGAAYLAHGSMTISGGEISGNTATQNGGGAYLAGGSMTISGGEISGNTATENGGAAYLAGGTMTMSNGKMQNNTAKENGGGAYLAGGSMTMSGGQLLSNTAVANGGGAYITGGNFLLSGGSVGGLGNANTAVDGGGIYVSGGNFTMDKSNDTTETLLQYNEAKGNGGGVYVGDGKVLVHDGQIINNKAGISGGGIFANANKQEVSVTILSGELTNNRAESRGGGIAVESNTDQTTEVTFGICETHPGLDYGSRKFTAFEYKNPLYKGHTHKSCPVVQNNKVGSNGEGGGVFMNSTSSELRFYCVLESGNTVEGDTDSRSKAISVKHGKVIIGEEDNTDEDAKGNIQMSGTTLVTGGQVDIWGNMRNPYFTGEISVDITNTNDKFIDHRKQASTNTDYKVHYYENFKGDKETATGLYTAKQYPDPGKIAIAASIYNHPGWKIVSWNTKADGTGTEYKVGAEITLSDLMGSDADEEVTGMNKSDRRLTLYAIWEKWAYTIKFSENRPTGVTGTGSMDSMTANVGEKVKLNPNKFTCIGYIFDGWNTNANGTGTSYADGDTIDALSSSDGTTVTLYAKWKECTHTDPDRLSYTKEGDWLVETCTCGGHTAKIGLKASDAVYDKESHGATITQDGDDWAVRKPDINYLKKSNQEGSYSEIDSVPVNAGSYKAQIEVNDLIIYKEYTISKASQDAPGTLTYTYKNGVFTIGDITDSSESEYHRHPKYTIKYWSNGTEETLEQESNVFNNIVITANSSFTYSAFYQETENYQESDTTSVTGRLSNEYDIRFVCEPAVAVTVRDIQANTTDGTVKYEIAVSPGYHKCGFSATIALDPEVENSRTGTYSFEEDAEDKGVYNLRVTPDSGTGKMYLVVTITGVIPDAKLTSQVQAGQVFEAFQGDSVTISKDSAYTIQFDVTDRNQGDYNKPALKFSSDIPKGTSIIMQTEGEYWFYKANSVINKNIGITLSSFEKMGGTGMYSDPDQATSQYRFIIDFSQVNSDELIKVDSLTTEMTFSSAAVSENEQDKKEIPDLKENEGDISTVTLKSQASFNLEDSFDQKSNSHTLSIGYTPSDGSASIWNRRVAGIVLSSTADIPEDLMLEVKQGENTTEYSINANKQFILPLGDVSNLSAQNLQITLKSNTRTQDVRNYPFTASLYVADSNQTLSPLQGYLASEAKNISLNIPESALPSIKITNQDYISTGIMRRLYLKEGELKMHVDTENIDTGTYSLTASIERWDRTTKEYISTNFSQVVTPNAVNTFTLRGQNTSGSYRLVINVSEGSQVILKVPYYFILE